MQALKQQAKEGKLEAPGAKEEVGQKVEHKAGEKTVYTLSKTISEYRRHRDALGAKDPKTVKREYSGLNFWEDKYGKEELGKVNDALLKEFAEWRKGMGVSGRAIDLDVLALRHVLTRAVDPRPNSILLHQEECRYQPTN